MINPVNSKNSIKADFFYVNDIHGQVPKMERLVTASRAFDEFVKTIQQFQGNLLY